MSEIKPSAGISWRHPAVFAVATVTCTILAIWAVVLAPVNSVSGVFGVGALAVFGSIPMSIFPSVFFGWVFGDIMVLATLGTILTVSLTPLIIKSNIYVRRFFS